MGYFSNGNEGTTYQAQFCDKCVNYRDKNDGRGPGCPIWDAHLLWNYQQEDKKEVLDFFIPRDGLYNAECTMFLEVANIP